MSALNAALSGFVFEAEAERSKPGSPRGQQVCVEPLLPSSVCKCFHHSLNSYFDLESTTKNCKGMLLCVRVLGEFITSVLQHLSCLETRYAKIIVRIRKIKFPLQPKTDHSFAFSNPPCATDDSASVTRYILY